MSVLLQRRLGLSLLLLGGRGSSTSERIVVAGNRAKPLGNWASRLVNRTNSGAANGSETKDENVSKEESDGGSGQESSESRPSVESLLKLLQEKDDLLTNQDREIKDLKDKYMRALAETENTRQRMAKQIQDSKLFGIQDFSKDILDIADILEKAIESIPQSELEKDTNPPLSTFYTGINLMKSGLQKTFTKHGLTRIDPLGEVFDPSFHEALFEVPGEKPGTIGAVTKVGYVLNGRTIRPALVGVVRATETK